MNRLQVCGRQHAKRTNALGATRNGRLGWFLSTFIYSEIRIPRECVEKHTKGVIKLSTKRDCKILFFRRKLPHPYK